MKIRTDIKSGGLSANHNETLVADCAETPQGLRVETGLKAGGLSSNHNETLVDDRAETPRG